ncbi:MAG: HipA domain-containing protein [Microcoleaceae cyanobacterium MO_207.B10]|nr:HipA domain-containing protein [Microcoleaceae cyanobacterium MO_207.B10]
MSDLFKIIEVSEDSISENEQLGTKEKYWYCEDEINYLYKKARPNTGEAWAEKITSELCELLNLPHAHYELAIWKDNLGTISPSFVPDNNSLILGNQILVKIDESYPEFSSNNYRVSEHTLDIVVEAIANNSMPINLPLNWKPPEGIETAIETFVGYLLLDAWIGNTDRHHENWGFIMNNSVHLAPTFDHASSLGRELPDSQKQNQINNKAVKNYLSKSRSAMYDKIGDKKAMLTLDVFEKAAQKYPQASLIWLQNLANILAEDTLSLLERIPQNYISEISIEFAQEILTINQNRLLQIRENLQCKNYS